MDRLLLMESRMSAVDGSAPVAAATPAMGASPVPGFIQLTAVAAMATVAAVRSRTGIILVCILFLFKR